MIPLALLRDRRRVGHAGHRRRHVRAVRARDYPTEVVAIGGAALLLILGLLPYDAALKVLSNQAPWTIAAMFLIMGGLVRTGALEWLTQQADAQARPRPRQTVVMLLALRGAVLGLHEQHARSW